MSREPKLVMLDWLDTTTHSGWREREESLKSAPCLCRTIGWLLGEDKERLQIAATRDDYHHWNDRSSIPKGCIIRRQVLDVALCKLERDKKKGKR